MKRCVVRVMVCLVLGVMTTVSVAWRLAAGEFVTPLEYKSERYGGNIIYRVEVVSGIGRVRRAASEQEPYSIPILPLIAVSGDGPTPPGELRHASERWGRLITAADPDSKRLDREGKEEACGWPRLALWCDFKIERGPSGRSSNVNGGVPLTSLPGLMVPEGRALPCRPIWSGLIIDSAVYACLWGAVWFVCLLPGRVRRGRRMRRGLCGGCGYELAGLVKCPECGK